MEKDTFVTLLKEIRPELVSNLYSRKTMADGMFPILEGAHTSDTTRCLDNSTLPFVITFDGWTTKGFARQFVSIIVSWVELQDTGFEVRRRLIDFKHPGHSVTSGVVQAQYILDAARSVGISETSFRERCVFVVADNAEDTTVAAHTLGVRKWGCLCHMINLAFTEFQVS